MRRGGSALFTRGNKPAAPSLRSRMLYATWAAWLAIVSVTVGIFVAAAPLRYTQLVKACAGPGCARTAAYLVALDAVSALVWCALALLIFWRRPGDRVGAFAALTLLTFGVARFPDTPLALSIAYPAWWLPIATLRFLGSACLSLFAFAFPDGRFVPRATRWFAAAWIIAQIPEFFMPSTGMSSDRWPPLLRFAGFLAFVAVVVAAQVWRYRRISTPTQRLQTRWVVLGLAMALICYLALTFGYPLISAADPAFMSLSPVMLTTLTSLTFLLVPIALSIAVLRHRLYDVDIFINRALVYGSLTAALAICYLVSVLILQTLVVAVTRQGRPSALVIVVSTLLIATLFQPLRRRLQQTIDRRFYRRKYDASATIAEFAASMRHEVDLHDLRQRLLDVVENTMQPEHVSLWLRSPRQLDQSE